MKKQKIGKGNILLLIIFISIQLCAQEKITVKRVVKRIDNEFTVDKLYNVSTGTKVTKKEFEALVRNNPNLAIEPFYDNEGHIVKYLYNPDKTNSLVKKRSGNKEIEIDDYFPELNLKTVDGQSISTKDLKGKMVILRFELEADSFRFKKDEIVEIDKSINLSQRQSEIQAIIIFEASVEEIKKGFDLKNSNFKLIPNGFNFHQMLNIKSFPSTIILDKEGRLMGKLDWSESINIINMLNKS